MHILIFFQILVDSFVNSLQLWPYWFYLTSISCIILMQKKLSMLLLSILCFLHCPSVSLQLSISIFSQPRLTPRLDSALHALRALFRLQQSAYRSLADTRWAFWQTAWHNRQLAYNVHAPPSYFPQVLNGLLGTAEVIHKKWYMKIKAQNFNAPQRSGSFSWAKMHSQEAALKQTRRVMTLASSLVLCTCRLSLMSLIVGCNLDWTHCITVVYTHH